MKTSISFAASAFIASQLISATAWAAPNTHDGFFLRAALGGGYTNYAASDVNDVNINGGAVEFDLDVGGAVAENFILYGHFSNNTIPNPTAEIGSVEVESDDTRLSRFALAAGATYYIMPANVSLNLGVGFAIAELEIRDDVTNVRVEGNTDAGVYLFAGVGKEWWIADEWGLGLGIKGSYARIPDGGFDYDALTISGLVTITYN